MTSVENNISEPPKFEIFRGGYCQTPYKARTFGTCDNAPPPRYKRPTYGPAFLLTYVNTLPLRI